MNNNPISNPKTYLDMYFTSKKLYHNNKNEVTI